MDPSKYVDADMGGLISDLQLLIRQPSISAKNEGIEECASLVRKMLEKIGDGGFVKTSMLRVKGAFPAVYGEIRSNSNPHKTLLFYNHYDVQPVEPMDMWKDPPFSGKRMGNKIFGRGSSDDKGELVTRMKAVDAMLKSTGDVPCNIKFLIEGEEEIGSGNIGRYLNKYGKKLVCDAIIWEFGYVDTKNRPVIGLGLKGLLSVELRAKGPSHDVHSALAAIVENPVWRLVGALATLRDKNGKILIRDWYKEISPLSKNDVKLIRKNTFDEKSFKREFGIKSFVGNKRGIDVKKGASCRCNLQYRGDRLRLYRQRPKNHFAV